MNEKVTGGGAFPHIGSGAWNADKQSFEVPATGGMTLRDYFAAKAMQMHGTALSAIQVGSPSEWDQHIAERAYQTADAMLKARGQ